MIEDSGKRALVVGMGVSGIATAARLRRAGWTPVIIERAPARRTGGYFIALFGAGQAAARRLGILDAMHNRTGRDVPADLDRTGRSRPGMSFADLPGEPWIVLRGDAENAAYSTLPDDVEVRFSTVPTAIEQDDDGVTVTLHDSAAGTSVTERFDLVVGADGLRSTVRRLTFGPHANHLRRLGYMVAACGYPGTPPGLAPGQGATLLEPERSMWVFAFTDHEPTIMMTYRTDDVDAEFTGTPAERLRAAFGPEPLGIMLEDVIAAFEAADDKLFDSVEQVHMDSWHRGRVILLGDAAWCVTLYAGMGVSAGFMGADLLGAMLERHPGDIRAALDEWERALRPHIQYYQDNAFDDRKIFVMDNPWEIRLRRFMPKLARTRIGALIAKRFLRPEVMERKCTDIVGDVLAKLPTPEHERRSVA
ncbi:FAD-dependent monooxygenase [Nocardia miyunensis]|uniref:FAD-dependent monooxygenase n=1 Tax=Nocardia miyunensis TaxID=282684 RepID=UPI001C3FB532|nr:FAD-dependent monooxygenase [Nocardia miyunensis]